VTPGWSGTAKDRDNIMAFESLRDSGLVRSFSDVLNDVSDLVQKEIRLARAEVTEKISAKLQAGVWMGVAAVLGLIAALLVIQGIVFGIASFGLALHWACLLVAVVLAAAGAAAFFYGRSLAAQELMPTRTVRQITEDIKTAKEQLT
jgi:uncharacterized membrane protein YqjE